jgi:serine/threonine protein kinase
MGSVYRARDLHFPNVVKLVAVKEMVITTPDPLVRTTIVQNFEREANILATLNHSAIPRIYDYFSEEDRSYLVIEYIHGKDLEKVISDTDSFLSEEQVLTWAIELCDVLSFLHDHKPDPIIFRDMKPSNVMIDHNGDVKLIDFGIAKTFQTGQKGTQNASCLIRQAAKGKSGLRSLFPVKITVTWRKKYLKLLRRKRWQPVVRCGILSVRELMAWACWCR